MDYRVRDGTSVFRTLYQDTLALISMTVMTKRSAGYSCISSVSRIPAEIEEGMI